MTGAPQPGLAERLSAATVKIVLGWIYAAGLSQLVLRLNRLPTDPWRQIPAILAALLLLSLLTWGRYNLLALTGLGTVTGLLLWLTRKNWLPEGGLPLYFAPLGDRIVWSFDYLTGYSGGDVAAKTWLAIVLCLLLALLTYLMLVRFNSPFAAGAILLAAVLLARGLDRLFLYGWSIPAALVFIAALARHQRKTYAIRPQSKGVLSARLMLQALPPAAAVLILALAFSLIPPAAFHSRQFEGWVDDLSGQIISKQWNQVDFPVFSIAQAGYYPQSDQLGGPVLLSDAPLLYLSSSEEAFLLRGSVSQIYDGRRWLQDPDRTYYRFDSPIWQKEQEETYDLKRPDLYSAGLTAAQFNKTVNLGWSPVGLPTRTLFTAGKPLHLSLADPDPFLAYFRPSGQLFSKHWIQPGQWVLLTGRLLRTEQPNFADMVRKIQAGQAPADLDIPDVILTRYLQLPDLAEYRQDGQLRQLADTLTAGLDNPYDRVLALRYFLMTQFEYSLDVAIPPDDVDFVTWFLQTREGYCVYFATALVMLCRLTGVPARYVEGYYVPPASENGIRTLTGREAHAWSEVYLAGIGWVTVDATPGGASGQPEPTPGATPAVTPAASPAATLTPEPSVRPTGDPAISMRPDASPGAKDPSSPGSLSSPFLVLRWLLLLPILAGLWLYGRVRSLKRRHDPDYIRRRLPDPRLQLLFYWREIKILLHELGQECRPDQSPAQFLLAQTDSGGRLAGREDLVQSAATGLNDLFYGETMTADKARESLAELYDSLEAMVRANRGLWAWLLRVIKSGRLMPPDGQTGGFVIS